VAVIKNKKPLYIAPHIGHRLAINIYKWVLPLNSFYMFSDTETVKRMTKKSLESWNGSK